MLYPTVADVNKGSKSIIRQTKKKKNPSQCLAGLYQIYKSLKPIPVKYQRSFFFLNTQSSNTVWINLDHIWLLM